MLKENCCMAMTFEGSALDFPLKQGIIQGRTLVMLKMALMAIYGTRKTNCGSYHSLSTMRHPIDHHGKVLLECSYLLLMLRWNTQAIRHL